MIARLGCSEDPSVGRDWILGGTEAGRKMDARRALEQPQSPRVETRIARAELTGAKLDFPMKRPADEIEEQTVDRAVSRETVTPPAGRRTAGGC